MKRETKNKKTKAKIDNENCESGGGPDLVRVHGGTQ